MQPACFGYDEADRMISLTAFRAGTETISSDPTGRADGDTTTWEYHDASGLEVRKAYADGSQEVKTYDAFNRLATETDARGVVKTHAYDPARGLQLSTTYSDGSASRLFAYDHLGNLTQVTDAAGVRSLRADAYGEPEVDELLADGARYTLTEQRDSFGRSVGFTYAVDGAVQHAVSISYAADGRIASAAFEHGGVAQRFEYGYLPGSNLLAKLSHPSGVTLTQSFEEKRDLLTEITYQRGGELLTRRSYTYDALGRPTARDVVRGGELVRDSFMHNSRSELISAQVDGELYGYDYDNIGNRRLAIEGLDSAIYQANELNQYTAIHEGAGTTFSPLFDAAGNQTLVKTGSGVWRVTYNAENRPISFTSEDGSTVVESDYDYQGRRCYKKITTNGEVTLHQRYLYRGFLQIAACNLLPHAAHPAAESGWCLLWDPSQPTATRPLAMAKGDDWFSYAWDLTKNITELYDSTGSLRTAYTYTPFGAVATDGDVDQPIQWSSEFYDAELGLVYYNYWHYNSQDGRWIGRDPSRLRILSNLYNFDNSTVNYNDVLGLFTIRVETEGVGHVGIDANSQSWNFGRYLGSYMKDIDIWGCKKRISLIYGPLILQKGGYKDIEVRYKYKTSAQLENIISNILNEKFNNGTQISKMDSSITDRLKGNGSYRANADYSYMRYMNSDWGISNNCATNVVDVIMRAGEKAKQSSNDQLKKEGIKLLKDFSAINNLFTPSQMKFFLEYAEKDGMVKK